MGGSNMDPKIWGLPKAPEVEISPGMAACLGIYEVTPIGNLLNA